MDAPRLRLYRYRKKEFRMALLRIRRFSAFLRALSELRHSLLSRPVHTSELIAPNSDQATVLLPRRILFETYIRQNQYVRQQFYASGSFGG